MSPSNAVFVRKYATPNSVGNHQLSYLPLDPSLKLGQAGVQLVDGNMNSNDLNPSIV